MSKNVFNKPSRDGDRLIQWSELEPWMKDNEYLLTGYRKTSYSFTKSLKSVFRIHNETVNIWSHIIGSVQFVAYLYHLWTTWPRSSTRSVADVVAITVYQASVVGCFGSSVLFHAFTNHSREVHMYGNKLDLLGIVGVLYGTALAATYVEFYCRPDVRNAYWALSTSFAIASAVFSLKPEFSTPTYRSIRVYAYSLLGLSCFIPIAHGFFTYGYKELDNRMSVTHFVGLALCQFSGGLIYGARVPERWFPKTFDVWGASHQIMHVMVVFGAMIYDRGLFKAMDWWNSSARFTCPADLQ